MPVKIWPTIRGWRSSLMIPAIAVATPRITLNSIKIVMKSLYTKNHYSVTRVTE